MLYKNLPEKDLKHVMHARFWLDYIAAAKFLLTGHYPNARAVYEARKAFHELKPSYEPVRRENLAKTKLSGIPELRKGSLILAFYLQGKKEIHGTMNRENFAGKRTSTDRTDTRYIKIPTFY